jgi:hypothetical protein
MTQEQVVQQVLGRVKMEESQVGIAQNVLQLWVASFPSKYMFGHREVLWRLPGSVGNMAQKAVGFECASCKKGKHSSCVSLRCACLRCHPARPTPHKTIWR